MAVKENPLALTGVVQQEEERNIHLSHAGETRHTSGEYVQCSSCCFLFFL